MKRRFTTEFLTEVLNEEAEGAVLCENKATGKHWDDGLVEGWRAVFSFESRLYGFDYRAASAALRWSGDTMDPFEHVQEDSVECDRMLVHDETISVYTIDPGSPR